MLGGAVLPAGAVADQRHRQPHAGEQHVARPQDRAERRLRAEDQSQKPGGQDPGKDVDQADAPVDVLVNGCLVARGEVVVIDGDFGVRVTAVMER